MKLPLVDEVREARRLAEEAAQAASDLQQVHVQLSAVAILERQADVLSTHDELPASELVAELTETWPLLADLRSMEPVSSARYSQQLSARRAQLELAQQVLRPLALAAKEHSEALHHLQHEQRHALEDPTYAEEVAALVALGERRGALAHELPPFQHQLAILAPARTLCKQLLLQLEVALAESEASEDPLTAFWVSHMRGQAMLDSIAQLLSSVKLTPPPFDGPVCPSNPHDATVDGSRIAIRGLLAHIENLASTLDHEDAKVRQTHDRLAAEYEEIEAQLKERMG